MTESVDLDALERRLDQYDEDYEAICAVFAQHRAAQSELARLRDKLRTFLQEWDQPSMTSSFGLLDESVEALREGVQP